MKSTILSVFLILGFLTTAKADELRLEEVPINHVYVPKGFDSNDNVEVVIKGYLPNLCYKVPRIDAKRVGDQIQVQAFAYRYTQKKACAEMTVPFLKSVSLGFLEEGMYTVEAKTTTHPLKTVFKVDESTTTFTDDHIYANVDYVESLLDGVLPTTGPQRVVLRGEHPNNCLTFDKVKFVSNGSDTISILPIMKVKTKNCTRGKTPFKKVITLPKLIERQQVLLHVRAMNGESVNKLFLMN